MKESSPSSLKPDVQYLRPIAAACQDIAALGDEHILGLKLEHKLQNNMIFNL